ncbi:MAG: signal recognition particle-docking protein FtsY [Desulfuromonadaceae bacterium]|nr:signal recognition particle-docking protein FtsY [Desulfuromonadaceae bacterium]
MDWLARYDELIVFLLDLLALEEGRRSLVTPYLYYGLPVLAALILVLLIVVSVKITASRKGRGAPEVILPHEEEPVPEEKVVPPAAEAPPPSMIDRMRAGLAKTRGNFVSRLDDLLRGGDGIDDDLWEELEEILIGADIGMKTSLDLRQALQKRSAQGEIRGPAALRRVLMEEIETRLRCCEVPLDLGAASPFVLMVIGVNGVGKTTTIGKLAWQLAHNEGKKVLLGACDTFRAAAAEQLGIWAERAGAGIVSHGPGADPAGVAFDTVKAALARQADVVILDTAGRLHTKVNLMEEVKKIRRVVDREIPGAPHETLLVLDATLGQNSLIQARLFKEAVDVSGLVLTKLDGTARGGMIIAVGGELGIPVRYVGIGEKVNDLRPFDPHSFVQALFENP